MKNILLYILSSIVDHPEEIAIKEEDQEGTTNFIVSVAKEDMGKVIGKNGKIIRAIRNVLKIPAIKNNQRIFVTLSETPQE